MALSRLLTKWLRRLITPGSTAQQIHDSHEDRFGELYADAQQVDANTVLDTASSSGLNRWGIDLAEPRLPGQTDDQYRKMLKSYKQGNAVNLSGVRYAIDKWLYGYWQANINSAMAFWDQAYWDVNAIGAAPLWDYSITEGLGPTMFWDVGYFDQVLAALLPRQILITFNDPFAGGTFTPAQKTTAQQVVTNATRDVNRVRAAGVQVLTILPSSLM